MQDSILGITLMSLVVVTGALVGIRLSRNPAQRWAIIWSFTTLVVVIALFIIFSISLSWWWSPPFLATAAVIAPFLVYFIVFAVLSPSKGTEKTVGQDVKVQSGFPAELVPSYGGEVSIPVKAPDITPENMDATALPDVVEEKPMRETGHHKEVLVPTRSESETHQELDADTCFEKGIELRDKGLFAIAAQFFAECAELQKDAEMAKRVRFEQLACYVKADMPEKANQLARELENSPYLSKIEALKIDTVLRKM